MSSDLSRSLVDAAAEAIDNANLRGHHMKEFYARQYAPLAVAAVLETLADNVRYDSDAGFEVWHAPALRGLAAEVKSEEDKT